MKNLNVTIRIQDKGSRNALINSNEYNNKMLGQLNNPLNYKVSKSDPTTKHLGLVEQWCSKWLLRSEISPQIAWIVNTKAKPGVAFGNIKMHKKDNPLRLITSCCGMAIENLSDFTEFYLQPLARKQPSFIKDTTDLLNRIQKLNEQGPFPEGTVLLSWDVVSMFPNIDNEFFFFIFFLFFFFLFVHKGPIIRATFFFNLCCNIVALQVFFFFWQLNLVFIVITILYYTSVTYKNYITYITGYLLY